MLRTILKCRCSDRLTSYAPFILRVVTGAIFVMHGWDKIQNGGGVFGTANFLYSVGFPVPTLFAALLIAAELGGGILLILGLFTHWIAKVLAIVSLIAFLTVHVGHGFFISAGGYEYILLIFTICVSIAITGPGRWSVDAHWRKYLNL